MRKSVSRLADLPNVIFSESFEYVYAKQKLDMDMVIKAIEP